MQRSRRRSSIISGPLPLASMANITTVFPHPTLGSITGKVVGNLVQFKNIPYGKTSQRFARSSFVQDLPKRSPEQSYNATDNPPASIQPIDSGRMDCKGNQFPMDLMDGYEEAQSEDCLRLNITMPASALRADNTLPVLVFVHGGAFFIGSSTRPYYDPLVLCESALKSGTPQIFVSMNYRLGGLGFFHSPEANKLMPANNGIHDQRIGFEWVRQFIGGFGGDVENINAMGQSAGGMSVTIHNLSGHDNVWKRSIQFSGSLATMPNKSPAQHQENFLAQAKKLGLDPAGKTSKQLAQEMISLPVDAIRKAGYVGLPCSESKMLPYSLLNPTALMSKRPPQSPSLASQIVSSTTYDGGISYNLMIENTSRKNHAQTFGQIAKSALSDPQALLDLYSLEPDSEGNQDDANALRKICQFESDIGFWAASLSQARGFPGKTYLLLFDLGIPFEGLLPAGECATHTWDIVALLGSCEERLNAEYRVTIGEFRQKILRYVSLGEEPWPVWTEEEGKAMVVGKEGLRVVGKEDYMGALTRRGKLLALADKEAGEDGIDLMWGGVCRRFLMDGR